MVIKMVKRKDRMKEVDDKFGITEDAKRRAIAVDYTIDTAKRKHPFDEPRMTE